MCSAQWILVGPDWHLAKRDADHTVLLNWVPLHGKTYALHNRQSPWISRYFNVALQDATFFRSLITLMQVRMVRTILPGEERLRMAAKIDENYTESVRNLRTSLQQAAMTGSDIQLLVAECLAAIAASSST